jgi:hypothetical protein
MPKGRLYDGEGIATMGRQNLQTRWVEKLAFFYLCVCLLSLNRCSKDSSRALKGVVANWPHHTINTLVSPVKGRLEIVKYLQTMG